MSDKYERWARRNQQGKQLEKNDQVKDAARLYLRNVQEEADTPHPYRRLCIIFRKRYRYDEEAETARKALDYAHSNLDPAWYEKRIRRAG